MGNWFVEERQARIRELKVVLAKLKEEGTEVDIDHFISQFALKWGLTRNKVKEYIKLING